MGDAWEWLSEAGRLWLLVLACFVFGSAVLWLILKPNDFIAKWARKKNIPLAAVMLAAIAASAGGGVFWWKHNRMELICVIKGLWGDGGIGYPRALKEAQEASADGDYLEWFGSRIFLLNRYAPDGKCAPQNREKYFLFAEETAEKYGWPYSQYITALRYGYGDHYYTTNPYRKEADAAPSPDSPRPLMPRFFGDSDFGDGKDLRPEKSFALMQKAAEQDFRLAMQALSDIYLTGRWGKNGVLTVGVDAEKSLHWLERAAEDGSYEARLEAGIRRRYGEKYGLAPDYKKARAHFLFLAEKESDGEYSEYFALFVGGAMTELALMHAEGAGVERDPEHARVWMKKAEQTVSPHPQTPARDYYENQRHRLENILSAQE